METKPIQLTENVGMYVDRLRKRFDSIEEVWLIGAHANGTGSRDSDWELLIFADEEVLAALRSEAQWQRSDVSLLIVVDGEHFEKVGDDARRSSLASIEWYLRDPQSATYRASSSAGGAQTLNAVRVR
jgi:hypothetical protein